MKWGMIPNQTVIALDCRMLVYTAYYGACKDYREPEAIKHATLFGVLSRILSMGFKFKTNKFVFCWDSSKSYREKQFPNYKQNRYDDDRTELCRSMFPIMEKEIFPKIGFTNQVKWLGLEADDIMAVVAKQNSRTPVVIATADQDLLQCLDTHVCWFNFKRDRRVERIKEYTADSFRKQYGIEPKQWADVKSIMGCKSDFVPGIGGVGIVAALQYLKGTLPAGQVFKCKKIASSAKAIAFNRRLVTLPHEKSPESVEILDNDFHEDYFKQLCIEHGMDTFLVEKKGLWERFFIGDF